MSLLDRLGPLTERIAPFAALMPYFDMMKGENVGRNQALSMGTLQAMLGLSDVGRLTGQFEEDMAGATPGASEAEQAMLALAQQQTMDEMNAPSEYGQDFVQSNLSDMLMQRGVAERGLQSQMQALAAQRGTSLSSPHMQAMSGEAMTPLYGQTSQQMLNLMTQLPGLRQGEEEGRLAALRGVYDDTTRARLMESDIAQRGLQNVSNLLTMNVAGRQQAMTPLMQAIAMHEARHEAHRGRKADSQSDIMNAIGGAGQGMGEIAGTIAGIALAPATGGLSLAIPAALAVGGGGGATGGQFDSFFPPLSSSLFP